MFDRGELGAWLRLLLTPGIGRATARRLLAIYGSPQAVFQAPLTGLRLAAGPEVANDLQREPEELSLHLAGLWAWLGNAQDRRVITLGDPLYPPQLVHAADPPLLLYVQGDPAHLAAPSIAVVGSRNPTPQGAANAREFARCLGAAGYVVVSGLALGVDGEAHEGALAAGAPTIAVLGTGLDRVYPKRHHALAHRIAERGALVSEFVLGTAPLRENFPQRNRIIAGLSVGTLVVEAALQSGSLITARLAGEFGREVFAIPGSIHAAQSRGCHALIRDGAKLVETAQEIVDELHQPLLHQVRPAVIDPPLTADPLLDALGHDPVTLDSLLARTGMATAELLARLLELELDDKVARLPGGLYQRRITA